MGLGSRGGWVKDVFPLDPNFKFKFFVQDDDTVLESCELQVQLQFRAFRRMLHVGC
jgi:hypothetical protein